MHKAVGLDGRRDPHRVLQVLQEIDADIVALQEADKRVGGRGSTVPHELIDSHGMYKPVHLGVKHKRTLERVRKHPDLSGLWRKRQMRAILDAIARRPNKMPTVLMGDTSEWRTEAGCLREIEPEFHVAPTGPSFHARHPVAALDRIIVHKDLTIEAAGVHMSHAAPRASDHLPIWARLSA